MKGRKFSLTTGKDADKMCEHKKAGTVPRTSPQARAKGSTGNFPRRSDPVRFVVTRAPFRQPRFYFLFGGAFPSLTQVIKPMKEIRDKEVRLISESGEQLGIMSSQEALRLAEEHNLDLVKISPTPFRPCASLWTTASIGSSRPSARRKPARISAWWRSRRSGCPPALMSTIQCQAEKRSKFLSEGNRCKVTVRFRGREMAHTNIGQDLLLKFAEECGEIA